VLVILSGAKNLGQTRIPAGGQRARNVRLLADTASLRSE